MTGTAFQGILTLPIEILETIFFHHLDLRGQLVLIGTCQRMHNTFAETLLQVVKVSLYKP